jgi:hypothetical protein
MRIFFLTTVLMTDVATHTNATIALVGGGKSIHARDGYQFPNKNALVTAVQAWCTNRVIAAINYGDINTWDVRTRICTHSPCCPPLIRQ